MLNRSFTTAFALMLLAAEGRSQIPRFAPPPACIVPRSFNTSAPLLAGVSRGQQRGISIAVLPIDRILDDVNTAHLPWALHDRLTTALAATPGWRVMTTGSASRAAFAAGGSRDSAAKLLRVQYVINGRVVQQKGTQEVVIELRRVGQARPVWQTSFGSHWTLKGMLLATTAGVQRAVLKTVESSVPQAIMMSDSAYDAVAAGDFALLSTTAAGADSARAHFERALNLDANSAVAAARLARSYALILERGGSIPRLGTQSILTRAVALTTRALTADPRLAEAWTVRAMIARLRDPVQFGGAIAAHARAVWLNANDAEAWHEYGVTMLRRGAPADAETAFRRALAVEPNRGSTLAMLGEIALLRDRVAEACQLTNASIDAWPFDPLPYVVRARARLALGQTRDAYSDAETAAKLTTAPWVRAMHVLVQMRAGNPIGARREASTLAGQWLRRGVVLPVRDAISLARAFTIVGERKRAIEALLRAHPPGLDLVVGLRDRAFDPIRRDTTVVRILREASGARGP